MRRTPRSLVLEALAPMSGWLAIRSKAICKSSRIAFGAEGRFSAHQAAALSICLAARRTTFTPKAISAFTFETAQDVLGVDHVPVVGVADRLEEAGLLLGIHLEGL